MPLMATPQRLTPSERDRALGRLRRLTAGAAVGAAFGLGGMAYVAAAVYPGHASSSSSGTSLATTGPSSSASASTDSISASTATAAPTASATAAPTAAPTAARTASSKSAAVTTGGS